MAEIGPGLTAGTEKQIAAGNIVGLPPQDSRSIRHSLGSVLVLLILLILLAEHSCARQKDCQTE